MLLDKTYHVGGHVIRTHGLRLEFVDVLLGTTDLFCAKG